MISSLRLTGFTNFGETAFTFSPGINIFIGKNGTGKTHILKCLAASLAANNEFLKSDSQAKDKFEGLIADKLKGFFKPEQLGRLVKRQQGRNNASVRMMVGRQPLAYSFATNSKTTVKLTRRNITNELKSLYIPPREMFSLYEGFLGLVSNREVSFDETYVMLARALEFDTQHWEIIKYDSHSDYMDISNKLQGTKAVDFLGFYNNRLIMFEIKNFRGYGSHSSVMPRIENNMDELTTEIAQKVKDTIAIITGLGRSGKNTFWEKVFRCIAENQLFTIVAWIEEDINNKLAKRRKFKRSVRKEYLDKKLSWLTNPNAIHIDNVKEQHFGFEGFSVTSV